MDIIEQAQALNKKASELNKQREKALWDVNRAKEELERGLNDYNVKYNTSLTIDTIEVEYEKVVTETRKQAEKVQAQIEAIERGEDIVPDVVNDNTVSNIENGVQTNTVEPTTNGIGSSGFDFGVDDSKVENTSKVGVNTSTDDTPKVDTPKADTPKVEEPKPSVTTSGFDFSKYI